MPGRRWTVLPLLALAPFPGCGRGPEEALPDLPIFLQLKDFRLVDQDGLAVGPERLRGRVWVLDFIFTRCASLCPGLTREMLDLAHEWRKEDRVAFLSITVDPEYDTPEVLRRYANLYGPRRRNWTLVTGDKAGVRDLVVGQVKLAMGEQPDETGDITHSDRFVLLDPELRIRGFFRATEPEGRADLEAGLRALLAEAARGQVAPEPGLSGLPCPVEPPAEGD